MIPIRPRSSLLVALVLVSVIPLQAANNNALWEPAAKMSVPRSGAAAVALKDGRVLVTGGSGADGPQATVEIYDNGSFVEAPSMNVARSGHTAVLLRDGRVLVAGGKTADGQPTWTAEMFDVAKGSWRQVKDMAVARFAHTATVLPDGRVLIAGGQSVGEVSDVLELFNPATEEFTRAASLLSSPRENHAAALLRDGRVLIAGGDDGEDALATIDVFSARTNTVTEGPELLTPRTGLTATSLMNDLVLFAGGSDGKQELNSAELFDPATEEIARTKGTLATARRNHLAITLPDNNSVLIMGGTLQGRPVQTTELFRPWVGNFRLIDRLKFWVSSFEPAATTVEPRLNATASASRSGEIVIAGGEGRATAERYRYPTLKTDLPGYGVGQNITITGGGWQAGDSVNLRLTETATNTQQAVTAVADASGTFTATASVPDTQGKRTRLNITGTAVSGPQAGTVAVLIGIRAAACTSDAGCGACETCAGATPLTPGTCAADITKDGLTCSNNQCVDEACNMGSCVPSGAQHQCPCTDVCDPATGCGPPNCPANTKCTTFACNITTNQCDPSPVNCDDGNSCTADACDATSGCTHSQISCADSNACTADSCDPATGCKNTPINCDDNNKCTADSCDPATGCKHATISCDDNNPCTADSCDPTTGCKHTPITCDDGNACTADACDPNTGTCSHHGISCDDNDACTTDSCDPTRGCVNTNAGAQGKVTGGGQVYINGDKNQKRTFGFEAKGTVGGKAKGHFNYLNHTTKNHVDGDVVKILFSCSCQVKFRVRTKTGCTYDVTVKDNGEPGTNDMFGMEPSAGYTQPSTCKNLEPPVPFQKIANGNIQCHSFKDHDEDDDDEGDCNYDHDHDHDH